MKKFLFNALLLMVAVNLIFPAQLIQAAQENTPAQKVNADSPLPAPRVIEPAIKLPVVSMTPVRNPEPWLSEPTIQEQGLTMITGTSHLLRFKRIIQRIAISDPEIADVALIDPKEVLLNAKIRGRANLIAWDTSEELFVFTITVTSDPSPLKSAIESIAPNHNLQVFPTEKGFVVKGDVDTVEKQQKIADASKAFGQDTVSLVNVTEAKQILLEIRFIEVNRTAGMEFGADWRYIGEKMSLLYTPMGGASASVPEDGSFPRLGIPDTALQGVGAFQPAWDENNRFNAYFSGRKRWNFK